MNHCEGCACPNSFDCAFAICACADCGCYEECFAIDDLAKQLDTSLAIDTVMLSDMSASQLR